MNYQALDERDHLLKRPETYVGSVITTTRDRYLWDFGVQRFTYQRALPYNEALLKIIFEVIDNAVDNTFRDPPTRKISVQVQGNSIIVANDGACVPVVEADLGNGSKDWIPSTIFGVPRSGSNFHEERQGIGMNGIGVKATNILSKEFSIQCYDTERSLLFKQSWCDNMGTRSEAVVKSASKKPSMVTIVKFTPDMTYFNDQGSMVELVDIEKQLGGWIYSKLLAISTTHPNQKLDIKYNDKKLTCHNFKSYIGCFSDNFYYERVSDNVEVGFYVVPGNELVGYQHQSFVNGQQTTSDGSVHTLAAKNKLVSAITTQIYKKVNGAKDANVHISGAQIVESIHLFISARVQNPKFTSQTKVELAGPSVPVAWDAKKVLNYLKNSHGDFMSGLQQQLVGKMDAKLNKAMTSKTKHSTIHVPKLDDAHQAGTAKSEDTTLFLVEGDSAKTMVSIGMSVIGRKKYGVFPLKGKLLNAVGASKKKLSENQEITHLLKIIGLQFGKSYKTKEERKQLRYGRVCILTDADVDGMHITGLIIAFINQYWPSLVEDGTFLQRFITPIIKVVSGGATKFFYTMRQYEEYIESVPLSRRKSMFVQHLKGLGTSLKADTLSYFKEFVGHTKKFDSDGETGQLLLNIFDPTASQWRKDWLMAPYNGPKLEYTKTAPSMNISTFLQSEMHEYSLYNIKRSIPSAVDGLKVSQRKLLHYALSKKSKTPVKVAQLAGMAASETNYAHGEVSLQGTLVNMAQSFSGSNNFPLFTEDGAFGSRLCNGGDAASPRYIFTKLRDNVGDLIDIVDVLNYLEEENSKVEPEHFVPALPLVLLNGANGIGTGFRAMLPCFRLESIVEYVQYLNQPDIYQKPHNPLVPYYNGTYKTNDKTTVDQKSWIFRGQFEVKSKTVVHVTEIPIGISIDDYKEKVLQKLVEKSIIQKYVVDHVSENEPKFIVTVQDSSVITEEILGLVQTITKSCMNLLDTSGVVRQFRTPEEIIEYWFSVRSSYLEKQRVYTIGELSKGLSVERAKLEFISKVVQREISLQECESLEAEISRHCPSIPKDLYGTLVQLPIQAFTQQRISNLKRHISQLETQICTWQSTTTKAMVVTSLENFIKKRKI